MGSVGSAEKWRGLKMILVEDEGGFRERRLLARPSRVRFGCWMTQDFEEHPDMLGFSGTLLLESRLNILSWSSDLILSRCELECLNWFTHMTFDASCKRF